MKVPRSSWKIEIVGGITTFFTMAYIVVVNPMILSSPGTGMPFNGVLTATVLLSFLSTLAMALYADLPFAVAPGMGINAFFTFTLILEHHIPWQVALGMIFWSGVIFLGISLTPLRESIARAIPLHLRGAAAAGIGVFLAFIGLKNAGLIEADPVTFVRAAHLKAEPLIALFGLVVMVALFRKRSPFAILAGIGAATAGAFLLGMINTPPSWVSAPDFQSVLFKMRPLEALRFSFLPSILAILFTDLFDSISTFVGVSQAAGLVDETGEPKNLRKGLLVDALATLGAGCLGTSSGTAFIESAAGIESGARTGLASVVTALLFLPCLFLAPLAGMIPAYATAPALIFVGGLMCKCLWELKAREVEEVIPAFLTLILIPLTFSISQGMLWGFLAHTIFYFLAGRKSEVPIMMRGIAVLSVFLLALDNLF
ncbi:MAG: NCS2 family permease [Bdellovibrionota bacterium]